jgi:hypothetical protein
LSDIQSESGYEETGLEVDFGEIASDSGATIGALVQDGKAFSKEIDKNVSKSMSLLRGGRMEMEYSRFHRGMVPKMTGGREVDVTNEQLRQVLTEGGEASDELRQFIASKDTHISKEKYPALFAMERDNPQFQKVVQAVGQMGQGQREELGDVMGKIDVLREAKATAADVAERGAAVGEELAALGSRRVPKGLRGVLQAFQRAGQQEDPLKAYRDAQEQAQTVASQMSRKDIARLRATGGAVAEHMADLADIEGLSIGDLRKRGARALPKGLRDELALAKQFTGTIAKEMNIPEKQLKAALESKKLTKDQAEMLKKTLQFVEKRAGLAEGQAAREDVQVKLNNSLRGFVGASENFVLAVSAAVPKLSAVSESQIAAAAKRISQGGGTGGTNSGKGGND